MKINGQDFSDFTLFRLLRLVLGAISFLALCASLIIFIVNALIIYSGYASDDIVYKFIGSVVGILLSASGLFYLGRSPNFKRQTLAKNPIAIQFKKQKLIFQFMVIILIFFFGFLAYNFGNVVSHGQVMPYVLTALFFIAFIWLGRTLWRCPACGYRIPFLRKEYSVIYLDRSSIKYCPNCGEQLQ